MAKLRSVASLFGLLAVLVTTARCNLVAGLADYEFRDGGIPDGATPCTVTGDCVDNNRCTDDVCVDGVCLFNTLPDGPSPTQVLGDCKTVRCAAGSEVQKADNDDIFDDNNDCTSDTCTGATAHNTPKPDGELCAQNDAKGTCANGDCVVACGSALPPCDDSLPCTADTCDSDKGACVFTPLENGVKSPGVPDTAGDCMSHQCQSGKDVLATDDSDLPFSPSDCDQELCVAGTPTNPPLSTDTPCFTDGGKVCDGKGACVECNNDPKCSGKMDECQRPGCVDHVCVAVFTPTNTALSDNLQVPGDCQEKVCDGAGGITSIPDAGDTMGDGNPCTNDVCVNGQIAHPPSFPGTACGNGLVCDGAGSCVDCVNNGMCQPPATCGGCGTPNVCCCKPKTCAEIGQSCALQPDGCGGSVQCNNAMKDGTETDVDCGGASCVTLCINGKGCAANADCVSGFCADGVCCEAACNATCRACNLPGKVGQCTPISGAMDNNPVDICAVTKTCLNGVCKKLNAQPCSTNNECLSAACVDSVCCTSTCIGNCRSCNVAGNVGTCADIPQYSNDTSPICGGSNTCDGAGSCLKANGQACMQGNDCASHNCLGNQCAP